MIRSTIILSFTFLLLISCESTVIVGIEDAEKAVVVEAIISTDSTWVVDLSYSQSIFDYSDPEKIEDATIKVEAEGNSDAESTFFLDNNGNGNYTFGTNPTEGREYNMTIKVGEQIITAKTYVPKVIEAELTVAETIIDPITNEKSTKLELSIDENDSYNNYYAYDIELIRESKVSVNPDTTDNSNPNDYEGPNSGTGSNSSTAPRNQNPKFANMNAAEPLSFSSDEPGIIVINNSKLERQLQSQEEEQVESEQIIKSKLVYKVKVWSISEDYYRFLTTINSGYHSSDVYTENAYSNINNGRGIFAGYNYKELIIE